MDNNRHSASFTTALLLSLLTMLLTVILNLSPAAAEFKSPVVVTFFDVGMGDAVLLHQPDRCAVLVDAGPPGSGIRIGRYLRDKQIDHLDRLIVSHPHRDHFSGTLSLPAALTIDIINDNGVDFHEERGFPEYRHWRDQQNYHPLTSGELWQCGDILFTVLAVDPEKSRPEEINNSSLVLLVEAGPVRLLLPGDLEADGRRQLADAADRIKAQIVKIPHHARSSGYLGPWLDAVDPELSVISTGKDDGSDPGILQLVQEKSDKVWRTDIQGGLELHIDERGWRYAR